MSQGPFAEPTNPDSGSGINDRNRGRARAVRSLADALKVSTPYGAHALSGPGSPLPIVAPKPPRGTNVWAQLGSALADRGVSYVHLALREHTDYPPAHRDRIALLLNPIQMHGSLPVWHGVNAELHCHDLPSRTKGADSLEKAVMTAITMDLCSSRRLRAFTDFPWLSSEDPEPTQAMRWRARGRLLLHRLGVWPWACVDDGKLPTRWSGVRFPEPLGSGAYDHRAREIFACHDAWRVFELARLREQLDAAEVCRACGASQAPFDWTRAPTAAAFGGRAVAAGLAATVCDCAKPMILLAEDRDDGLVCSRCGRAVPQGT